MAEFLRLKKSDCKNCYKCIRHCPVKSIRFSGNQAHIINNECILCGRCLLVCPQNVPEIKDDTETLKVILQENQNVVATIAPSFVSYFKGASIKTLEKALMKLGFSAAEETAVGATIVKKEYERILLEDKPELLITSCCHSINLTIQKYFPNTLKFLAHVASPMQAHAKDLKKRYPDAKIVFVGPCVAKKDEADYYKDVDCVLTFDELSSLFEKNHITVEKDTDLNPNSKARLFPTTGGVLATMEPNVGGYHYLSVDGVENCMNAFKDIENGGLRKCVIEVSACVGSCVNGPVMHKYQSSPLERILEVKHHAGANDFVVDMPEPSELKKDMPISIPKLAQPTEEQIQEILIRMGKKTKDLELNCGSCGYNTCRQKAVAVYQGKANIEMCLPFLQMKAESFSATIMNNAPDGILVVSEEFEVQQMNNAVKKILNLRNASDVLGEQLVRILDPSPFMKVKETGRAIRNEVKYLVEYDRYVEWTIVYEKEYRCLICIMNDITEKIEAKEAKDEMIKNTIQVTDKVIDKQMRIVQEIASLLGETAAETKIALTKLKESIHNE